MKNGFVMAALLLSATLLVASSGCSRSPRKEIKIDGSSTVFLITEAVAEEFNKVSQAEGHFASVSFSGTGGGFKKFSKKEIAICDASRGIKDSEKESLEEAGVEYIELEVAYDGLAVITHPDNDWTDSLTVEQLKSIWKPESTVKNWSDVDPSWPKEPIKLYSPGNDSGTFDYFTKAICGKEKACRSDASFNEDDNVLVRGVANDKYSLGYFGYAYYIENKDKLKLLGVDGGKGPVQPSKETVLSGDYAPLSRPLYVYVSKEALGRPEVRSFMDFYIDHANELSSEVGYVPVSSDVLDRNRQLLK